MSEEVKSVGQCNYGPFLAPAIVNIAEVMVTVCIILQEVKSTSLTLSATVSRRLVEGEAQGDQGSDL